jgi:CHAT domain-containing protein
MEPTLGAIDEIQFSEVGLGEWESTRYWPGSDDADRAVLFSQLYLSMGSLLVAMGAYSESIRAFRRGLSFAGPAAPDLAQRAGPILRSSIAAALIEKGDLNEAQQELDRLSAQVEELHEPAHYVRIQEILAKLHLLRGEFGLAQAELQSIVRICEEQRFEYAECRARLNLGQMLIFLNKTTEARMSLEKAISIARRSEDHGLLGRATALMAIARERLASLAEGIPIAQSVAQLWLGASAEIPEQRVSLTDRLDLPQAGNYLAFFEDRLLGAHWELGRGRIQNARILFAEMRQIFGSCDSRLIALRLDAFEALLRYYEGDFDVASALLAGLMPVYSELGLKPEHWNLQRVLRWCFARMDRSRAEQEALSISSEALLEEMTTTLAPEDQAIYNLNKWTSDEEYLAAAIDRLIAEKKRAEASPAPLRWYRRLQVAKRLHVLSHRIDRFKEGLTESSAKRGVVDLDGSLRSFATEQLAHPSDAATLKFLVLPDRVVIIQRSRFRLQFGVSSVSRMQLRDLVRSWHEWTTGLRSGADLHAEAEAAAAEIGDKLQITSAISTLPSRVKSLRIIPDDSLHGFPFAALKYRNKFLVEEFSLSIQAAEREPPRTPQGKIQKALFAGVSVEAAGFPALHLAGDELGPFHQWTGQAPLTDLRDENVTREAMVAHLPSATFAHIAAHGVFSPSRPDATGLVLTPHPPSHEVLSITDIASLRLDALRHLTLSSCWSADNFVLPGRWVVSFPQRFHLAGAETVLACLWEVEQSFAVPFFARYYKYLVEMPPDEALARTQHDCISRNLSFPANMPGHEPIYWSGYQIYGSPKRITMTRQASYGCN